LGDSISMPQKKRRSAKQTTLGDDERSVTTRNRLKAWGKINKEQIKCKILCCVFSSIESC